LAANSTTPIRSGESYTNNHRRRAGSVLWAARKRRLHFPPRLDQVPITLEMENISTGPTFRDFVIILTERSVQDVMVARSRAIFTVVAITRKIVQRYCVQRVVYTVRFQSTRIIPCRHNKRKICIILISVIEPPLNNKESTRVQTSCSSLY